MSCKCFFFEIKYASVCVCSRIFLWWCLPKDPLINRTPIHKTFTIQYLIYTLKSYHNGLKYNAILNTIYTYFYYSNIKIHIQKIIAMT